MASNGTASQHKAARPVIVITGANAGVGFGIAQRFLVQLSSPSPPDTLPTHPHLRPARGAQPLPTPFAAPDGCVLVLACRNAIKAHRARAQLLRLLTFLEELPDDAETPTSVPAAVIALEQGRRSSNGTVTMPSSNPFDEDADPALVAQAMEASLRRRRRRSAAISSSNGAYSSGEEEENATTGTSSLSMSSSAKQRTKQVRDDPTRDPRTGRVYSLYEREIRARGRYRRRFCEKTTIEIQPLDLGSMASALQCAKDITSRHGYATHIVLNAGSSAFTGINWPHAFYMILTSFHAAVTHPIYKKQRPADVGKDGYGWVWQANLGAHYVLVRALLPALRATPYSTPSRIIWTGSLEAYEHEYDPSDYQCVDAHKSPHPYESSKYQCELAAYGLDEMLNRKRIRTEPGTPLLDDDASYYDTKALNTTADGGLEPKSFLAHPGVVASSIFADCMNAFLSFWMLVMFYVARWTFSKHHNIEAYKGAVAATHVGLAPSEKLDTTMRYGAQTDWHGREYCFGGRMDSWSYAEPTGRGKEEKQRILNSSLTDNGRRRGSTESLVRPGAYVSALARDVIVKCEDVARSVWRQAQQGALPPFSDLDMDEAQAHDAETTMYDYATPTASPARGNTSAASLSARLLPQKIRASAASNSPNCSSQDVKERVNGHAQRGQQRTTSTNEIDFAL